MGKRANGFKQKPESRKMAWAGILLLLAGVAIVTVACLSKPKPKQDKDEGSADATVDYIMSKLSAKPVVECLSPVIIFQYNDGEVKSAGAIKKIRSHMAGSGTMVKLSGKLYIITSEHLFAERRDLNYSCPKYLVQVLREGRDSAAINIVDTKPLFVGKPGLVDIAMCVVSKTRPAEKITPFSTYLGGGDGNEYRVKFNLALGKPEDRTLRSVLSGEKAVILGRDNISGVNDMWYYIIDYASLPGESGTGFVDGHGKFYVLKSSVSEGLEGFNKIFREQGLIDKDRKGFSVVIGALDIDTKPDK